MQRINNIYRWIDNKLQVNYIYILIITGLIFFYKLAAIPNGRSIQENNAVHDLANHTFTLHYLIHNPTLIPSKLYYVLLNYLNMRSIFDIRLEGILISFVTIFIFYFLLKSLTTKFIAFITVLILASSPWFLQLIRNSSSSAIIVFSAVYFIYLSILLLRSKRYNILLYLSLLSIALLLYVPGVIWLVLCFWFIDGKLFINVFSKASNLSKIMSIVISGLFVLPNVVGLFLKPKLALDLLAIHRIPLNSIISSILDFPKYLFYENTTSTIYRVGNLPLVSLSVTILIIFGLILLYKNRQTFITRFTVATILISWVLFVISGFHYLFMLLPLLSMTLGLGIFYLYNNWLKVFPKNPFAKIILYSLLSILAISIIYYQFNQYFVVWGHTSHILAVYKQ
jgi:hypothetical protein